MNKITPLFILISVLFLVSVTASEISVVKAEATIYIKADGLIEGTEKIQRDGNVYTFLENINIDGSGIDGIIVKKDNIIIDGKGYTLQGQKDGTDVGIKLSSITDVTIKNIEIKNFSWGISLYNSLRNTVSGNTLTNNVVGIHFWAESDSNTISENTITTNEDGIFIYGSSNIIVKNTITLNSGHGIDFFGSSNIIAGNYIAENGVGVYVNGNIPFVGSQNNNMYCNNFINNTKQVSDILWGESFSVISVNVWDKNKIGNYWSNYNGTDVDDDGVGDTPYVIDENNQDNYPLTEQIEIETIPDFEETAESSSFVLLLIVLVIVLFVATIIVVFYKRKIRP